MRQKRVHIFLITITAVSLQLWLPRAKSQSSRASEGQLVQVSPETVWDPIWITKVQIGNQFLLAPYDAHLTPLGGQVMPGRRFSAGSDWLKSTTIYVMNRTSKPLARLEIGIQFPQTGNGRTQSTRIYYLKLGRIPDADAFDKNGKAIPAGLIGTKPLDLQPGGTLTIQLSDYVDQIQNYLAGAMPLSPISECNIYVASSEFADGLRYAGGAYSIPDPHNPGQWSYYPARRYFPGNAHLYLPNVER